ncbi:hypothetical protein AHAS_Ahas11G0136000 [Arachis hypogaea]
MGARSPSRSRMWPPPQHEDKKRNFRLKTTWLRNKVSHNSTGADASTLCQRSALLSHTYHSLGSAVRHDTTDITRCVPLVMSWIYHRFPTFCPAGFDTLKFSLASRLVGLGQQIRDNHHDKGLRLRSSLDALRFDEFRWTPYDVPQLRQMTPDWIKSIREIHTWRSMVPLVCFHFVEFHHVERIKKQLDGEHHRLEDPVNMDEFLFRTTWEDDVWRPE